MKYFDIYLKSQGSNRNQVAEAAGLTASTLQTVANSKNGTDALSGKILKAIALTLKKSAGEVLDEMILAEKAISTLSSAKNYTFEPKKDHYWTFDNTVLSDRSYLEMTVSESLSEWIGMDDEEREDWDNDFSQVAENYLETEDDYRSSTKNGKVLSPEEW